MYFDILPALKDGVLRSGLIKSWDHRFLLSQWKNEFKLIQYLRSGSELTKIKCTISNNQAQQIINNLDLVRTQGLFNSSSSWRKYSHSELDMQKVKNLTI